MHRTSQKQRCYDERREGIIALGQAYTLGHITGMKEGRMVVRMLDVIEIGKQTHKALDGK